MSPDRATWHILTGEYPPEPGGVSDYTGLVARGLVGAGAEVHVWTSPTGRGEGGTAVVDGVVVHREAGSWTRGDLIRIGRSLNSFGGSRLLVQYAPNAYGRRGLNLALGRWLIERRRAGDRVRLMFHEVCYIVKPGDSLARRALAFSQRRLATLLLRAAETVDVAIPFWEGLLRPLDRVAGRIYGWRPVPSNVPVLDDPAQVEDARQQALPPGATTLVGSFGTFADDVSSMLAPVLIRLLEGHPDRAALLMGRGGERFADALRKSYPGLSGRLHATGPRDTSSLSADLQACDLLIQPYPGGVCTKRGSLMAGISHGRPTVTTSGVTTEPDWARSGAVALTPEDDPNAMVAAASALLGDPEGRERLGKSGRVFYDACCAIRWTIDALTVTQDTPSNRAEAARQ